MQYFIHVLIFDLLWPQNTHTSRTSHMSVLSVGSGVALPCVIPVCVTHNCKVRYEIRRDTLLQIFNFYPQVLITWNKPVFCLRIRFMETGVMDILNVLYTGQPLAFDVLSIAWQRRQSTPVKVTLDALYPFLNRFQAFPFAQLLHLLC